MNTRAMKKKIKDEAKNHAKFLIGNRNVPTKYLDLLERIMCIEREIHLYAFHRSAEDSYRLRISFTHDICSLMDECKYSTHNSPID